MTILGSGLEPPATIDERRRTVIDNELPISGCRAVGTSRGSRHTLEVFDSAGELLTVVSDSPLDSGVIRGSWRGVRDGRPWALVVGRRAPGPVTVTFGSPRPAWARRRVDVASADCGEFWVAEAAIVARYASVSVSGLPAGETALQRLRPGG